MTDTPSRNWSTKTLARQLIRFIRETNIPSNATVDDLLTALKSSIIEEEIGDSLDL